MEHYKEKAAGLTDDQLTNYVEQRHKYNSEIVKASVAELQKRGRNFTEEELQLIYADLEPESVSETIRVENNAVSTNNSEVPEYYSPGLIRIFSVLFSVLFGSIMMAVNLSRTAEKKGVKEVVIFGLIYTIALIVIGSFLPPNSGVVGIALNLVGGIMLEYFFWNKYIGAETNYKKRSFVIPLIIGVAISAIFIAIVYSTM